jgi:hypothetical protein
MFIGAPRTNSRPKDAVSGNPGSNRGHPETVENYIYIKRLGRGGRVLNPIAVNAREKMTNLRLAALQRLVWPGSPYVAIVVRRQPPRLGLILVSLAKLKSEFSSRRPRRSGPNTIHQSLPSAAMLS